MADERWQARQRGRQNVALGYSGFRAGDELTIGAGEGPRTTGAFQHIWLSCHFKAHPCSSHWCCAATSGILLIISNGLAGQCATVLGTPRFAKRRSRERPCHPLLHDSHVATIFAATAMG
jgi:hypothetical protein